MGQGKNRDRELLNSNIHVLMTKSELAVIDRIVATRPPGMNRSDLVREIIRYWLREGKPAAVALTLLVGLAGCAVAPGAMTTADEQMNATSKVALRAP